MLNETEATQIKQQLAKRSVHLDLGFILALRSAFECVDNFTLTREEEIYHGRLGEGEKETREEGEEREDEVDERAE